MNAKIYTKKIGNGSYCYYMDCYRVKIDPNDKGKTRNTGRSRVVTENIYLGKVEDVMKKLLNKNKEESQYEIGNFGLEAAAYDVITSLKLPELLEECFPGEVSGVKIKDYLLVAIINRISKTMPKTRITEYIKKGILKKILGIDWKKLTTTNYWLAYDKIISEKDIEKKRNKIQELKKKKLTKELKEEIKDKELAFAESEKIDKFQNSFFKILLKEEHIYADHLYLDATNFYNYIENNNGKALLCAKGKNKAGKNNLNQITLMMSVTKDNGIPIMHEIYKGNYTDVTLFPSYLTKLINNYVDMKKEIGEVYISYDKGNNSEKNYKKIEKLSKEKEIKINVIGSLKLGYHEELLKLALENYSNSYKGYKYYFKTKNVFEKDMKIIITYYEKSAKRQKIKFDEKLEKYQKKIHFYFDNLTLKTKMKLTSEKLQEYVNKNIVKYNPYQDIIKTKIIKIKEDIRLKINLDKKNLKKENLRHGKTIIFSNNKNLSEKEIIEIYHSKTKIDEDHKILKCPDGVLFHPNWHWTDSKLKVQAFVNIMALTLLKLMEKRFNENQENKLNSLVIKELLQEIKMVLIIEDKNKTRIGTIKLNRIKTELYKTFNLKKYLRE